MECDKRGREQRNKERVRIQKGKWGERGRERKRRETERELRAVKHDSSMNPDSMQFAYFLDC